MHLNRSRVNNAPESMSYDKGLLVRQLRGAQAPSREAQHSILPSRELRGDSLLTRLGGALLTPFSREWACGCPGLPV